MHACVLHAARDLRCEAIEPQSFGPGDVRIAVKAGGICGSDLHYYFSGGVGDFRVKEPLILGHEIAGEVIEVGAAVEGVSVGDRAVVNPSSPCARCRYCLEDRPNLCADMRFLGSAARSPHVQGGEPLTLLRAIGAADDTINVRTAPERMEALAADRGTFDIAWEAVGHPAALETAIACTRPRGRVVQIGQNPPGSVAAPLNRLMTKELTLVGSFRFGEEFAWAVDYLVSGRINVAPLYTGRFGIDQLDEAFHLAADRTRSMKVQIGF